MSIADNLSRVQERIANAAIRSGRSPESVELVGVTKTVDIQRIELAVAAGLKILGENYVQEARDKIAQLGDRVSWHFVGRLQTNKAKHAVKLFDLIETVDSMKLAVELNRRAHSLGRVIPIFIQLNLADEVTKGGVKTADALALVRQISELAHLQIRGLMTMPPFFNQPERARPYFRQLRGLSQEIVAAGVAGVAMTEISMGMSGDFEVAVEEGATLVRVGTAIFGERP
ncbi:MAG: YggS family pyridoxal phosphate-dependent enzyme [Deltaproteobacteria bacterium]|nr:MAG: YggS family pyridoxal phosphate-dependent enzyme [Deltaproteobacteria bacterium]